MARIARPGMAKGWDCEEHVKGKRGECGRGGRKRGGGNS